MNNKNNFFLLPFLVIFAMRAGAGRGADARLENRIRAWGLGPNPVSPDSAIIDRGNVGWTRDDFLSNDYTGSICVENGTEDSLISVMLVQRTPSRFLNLSLEPGRRREDRTWGLTDDDPEFVWCSVVFVPAGKPRPIWIPQDAVFAFATNLPFSGSSRKPGEALLLRVEATNRVSLRYGNPFPTDRPVRVLPSDEEAAREREMKADRPFPIPSFWSIDETIADRERLAADFAKGIKPGFKAMGQKAKTLVLEPGLFFFDKPMTELERPVQTATLRNDGERTVHVTDVIRTCVCANLELSTTNLPPGGSAEVRCTLDPNVFSGPFRKIFFIKTDDPDRPEIRVPIVGMVQPLWTVEPDKWHQMSEDDTNAVLRVKAAPDAPALVRTEILGPAGASFELRPAGEREFDAVFTPGDQPRGQHHWTMNLYPEGAETPALGLHLGKQVGEHWKCVPARLRAPVDGRDFVADLLVKPADGKDLPADVDPAAITISPAWDHVAIEPLGPPTWRGIPIRLTVGAEMVSSWEFPKTFYLTIPDHGVASVYFEKVAPSSDAESENR